MKEDKKQLFINDSKSILEHVGEDNIISATHCQTRLRLVLKDYSNIDNKVIERLDSVRGVFIASGQLQIVIGTEVPDFFSEFSKIANVKLVTKDEQNQIVKAEGSTLQRIMAIFSEIFLSLIPVIVAGGLILAFRNILELDWDPDVDSTWTFVGHSSFLNQLNAFLWLPANAIFWYLPVYVVWAMFNRKGTAQALGIAIGIMLVSPGILVNLYDVSGSIGQIYLSTPIIGELVGGGDVIILGEGIHSFSEIITALNQIGISTSGVSDNSSLITLLEANGFEGSYEISNVMLSIKALNAYYFFGIPLALSYIGQVVPALLVGAFAVWFYTFIDRHTWGPVRYVWPPLITILVTLFVAHGILGPIGAIISFIIDSIAAWGFTSPWAKWFVGPLLGFTYPFIIVTGVHHTLNAVMLDLTAFTKYSDFGANYIFPIGTLQNMTQGAAVFGILWMLRFDENTREGTTAAGITCWLGVTEPAMFGYSIKYAFPFLAACIGSGLGGLFVVGFNITAYGIGMSGLLGFLNVNHIGYNTTGSSHIIMAWVIFELINVLAVAVTIILTLFFAKKEKWFSKVSTSSFAEEVAFLKEKNMIKKEMIKE